MNRNAKVSTSKNTGTSTDVTNILKTPEHQGSAVASPGSMAKVHDFTPGEKPQNYYNNLVFIKDMPTMDYVTVKGTQKPLLNITGHNYLGEAILIQYWGDSAVTMLQVLNVSMMERNNHTYAIQNGDSIPSNEKFIMFLKEFQPNTFQVGYAKVFKLVCRSQGVLNGKLTPIAFLKPKKWPENATLPDGSFLPPPEMWPPNDDDTKFSIEDLAQEEDLEIVSPTKKQKN